MIFIIIPVHNRKEFTRNCLISLSKQTYKEYSVFIVDDGSTDGTAEMLAGEFPHVIVHKGNGNLWWTASVNIGVKYSLKNNVEYILLLNNDTIASEDFLERMIYHAEKEPTALLGAFALDENSKEPVYGGEIINWKSAGYKSLLDILPKEKWNGLHEVTHYPGRGLLIPSAVFSEIGLFDEKHFPHYAADYDFTHRAIRAGYKVYCNYDAKIFVYPRESSGYELRSKKSFKNYYNYLFGIKGCGNISVFIKYAWLNAPLIYKISFMFCGVMRRIFGYPLEWIKEFAKLNMKK